MRHNFLDLCPWPDHCERELQTKVVQLQVQGQAKALLGQLQVWPWFVAKTCA